MGAERSAEYFSLCDRCAGMSRSMIRASLCNHHPYFVGTPPPVGGLPPRWTGPPLRSVALSAAGGVTTDPPLGRCPCREPPQTLSLLLANRHGRFEIADFHYENQSRSQAPRRLSSPRPEQARHTRICGASTQSQAWSCLPLLCTSSGSAPVLHSTRASSLLMTTMTCPT